MLRRCAGRGGSTRKGPMPSHPLLFWEAQTVGLWLMAALSLSPTVPAVAYGCRVGFYIFTFSALNAAYLGSA